MTIRLEQMHPALVHLPIALLPLSVSADIVGGMTGNTSLLSFGKQAACFAALGAAASVATGLVAGEEVNVEGESMDMLITHRNVNIAATIIAGGMAIWRFGLRRPSAAYLLTGVIGIGLLTYSSYLGGKLVYEAGVGVEPAKGVYRPDAPTLKTGAIGLFVKTAGVDFVHGLKHFVQEVKEGKIAPTIMANLRKQS